MKHFKKFLFTVFCAPLAMLGLFSVGADGDAAGYSKGAENQDAPQEEVKDDTPVSDDNSLPKTQEELDDLIEKRLARERKKIARQAQKQTQTPPEPVNPEADKQPSELEIKAQKALEKARQGILTSNARVEASKLKIDPKYIDAAIKLADFGDVDINEDLSVDAEAIQDALKDVLKNVPVFTAAETADSKGFRVGKEISPNSATKKSGILESLNSNAKPWNRFK